MIDLSDEAESDMWQGPEEEETVWRVCDRLNSVERYKVKKPRRDEMKIRGCFRLGQISGSQASSTAYAMYYSSLLVYIKKQSSLLTTRLGITVLQTTTRWSTVDCSKYST